MQRTTILAALATTLALLSVTPLSPAQQIQPALPSDILGPQLISWSQQQRPQPVPQPLPDSPPQQPGPQPGQQPANPPSERPEVHTYTGKIVKDLHTSKFVLQVAGDETYQLDDQNKPREYEGKDVKIIGRGNRDSSRRIRVASMELISDAQNHTADSEMCH
jgi:Protein of unknown function (DUF5818)